jgi:hypothetical protein
LNHQLITTRYSAVMLAVVRLRRGNARRMAINATARLAFLIVFALAFAPRRDDGKAVVGLKGQEHCRDHERVSRRLIRAPIDAT